MFRGGKRSTGKKKPDMASWPAVARDNSSQNKVLRAMVILEMFAYFQHFSHEKMEPILGEVKLDLTCVVVLKDLPQKIMHEVLGWQFIMTSVLQFAIFFDCEVS